MITQLRFFCFVFHSVVFGVQIIRNVIWERLREEKADESRSDFPKSNLFSQFTVPCDFTFDWFVTINTILYVDIVQIMMFSGLELM